MFNGTPRAFATAGQMAKTTWQTFFEGTHGYPGGEIR